MRIVNQRRYNIDGLYKCLLRGEKVNSGIVGCCRPNQKGRICRKGEILNGFFQTRRA
jgi:hypothetical protein